MKFKPDQCESFTRSSQYSVRCKRKGFFCKTSKKYRCKFHAGMSTGPRSIEGRIKAIKNLKQYRNKSDTELYEWIKSKKYAKDLS